MSARTIILSDIHGFGPLLERALDHARPQSTDRVIIAGDLVDLGTDDVVALAEKHGAEVLVGNHEVAAALGIRIAPQNPETRARQAEFAERILNGSWQLATIASGWLVTHAGVSRAFLPLWEDAEGDLEHFVAALNVRFLLEMREYAAGRMPVERDGIPGLVALGAGPLWFRPHESADILPGVRQVAGHTPPEALDADTVDELSARDFLLSDPGAHSSGARDGRFRYVVIDADGAARTVEGGAS